MSDFQSNKDFTKFVGGFTSSEYESLPMQMIPRSKKNPKWQNYVMDTLENIGLKQIRENRGFSDYRKMIEGRLVYSDFDETQTDLRGIASVRKEQKLPTFLKHYDLIGRIIKLLAGEFNKQKDTINIVSTDIFSNGEFLREKDSRIGKFTEDYFNKVIEIGLLEKGLDPNKQDFKSEEEEQAYLEQLQKERDAIVPPHEIEKDLQKNFKTAIVEWAEMTLESNYIKFTLDMLDTEELIQYLSTGRYFRNYHVGYDSYEPETWDVERTFFSQDLDAKYPQDCEYVGTIHLLSGAKLLSKFGHLIPKNIQNKIYGDDFYGSTVDTVGPLSFLEKGTGRPTVVPHAGHYQQQTAQAMQNLFGVPWGNQYYRGAEGELESRYSWVNPTNTGNNIGWGKAFRDDVNVRTDQVQVTEAYFRSQKLMGLLTIETPLSNEPYQVMVEEDLIPEFLETYNIKKQSTKSWKEVTENPRDNINTITYGFLPQIWKGYKINASNTNLKDDYCFGVEPLAYQITGVRNEFDVKIPVGGIISSGIGEMIRPYQKIYNYVLNQNEQYIEKTLGTFFLMDWNLLPSQFKGENGENSAELIEKWREDIRELGFGLKDGSPQNTKGQNPSQNNIDTYDISFGNNIRTNMEIAMDMERKAFATIGITQERIGTPNEYMTTEGVKIGQESSYAQTEIIYKRFNVAKVKEKEIELSIAQYAATNGKDISVDYINGQNQRIVRNFLDPNFAFRKLEVYAADDSAKRRELETFKQHILNTNTMDNDIYDLGKVITSDNFVTLLEFGMQQKLDKQKQVQQQQSHEKEVQQIQIDSQNKVLADANKREDLNKQLDRESFEEIARIKARASLADNNLDPSMLDKLIHEEDKAQKIREGEVNNNLKQQEIDIKKDKQQSDVDNSISALDMQFLTLKEKAKDRAIRREVSKDKVDIARINP